MLTPDEVEEVTLDLWKRHLDEVPEHDRVADFVAGRLGVPEVPEGAGDELEDLARMSVKNVLSLVRDAFAQNLSVVGFRSPSDEQNGPVWDLWQRFKLDARQAEIHRATPTYGSAYAVVLKDRVDLRSPRRLFAAYEDPHHDDLPVYALDTWIDRSGSKPLRRGTLLDGEHMYPVTLGQVNRYRGQERIRQQAVPVEYDPDDARRHDSEGCPVVRFVNARDSEDLVFGEIAPLITEQKAINAVNFDRLVVSRFGAFPQKYVIGWDPGSKDALAKAGVTRLMAFIDDNVKAGNFAAASVEQYNSILNEMLAHVAMRAQVPVAALTGNVSNLSAEALAMVEAPHQRKLVEKRQSLGESWEQTLRLMASLNGLEVSEDAEVKWRETEARSFAQVVDGIQKLVASGVPVDVAIEDVPGWSQQRIDAVRKMLVRNRGAGMLDALRQGSGDLNAQA